MNLFENRRGWIVFFGLCSILFCFMLALNFYRYQTYMHSTNLRAKVLAQYTKGEKLVLKLRTSEGQILYTTSKEDLKDLTHREILLYGKSAPCDFLSSLKSCFFITYSLSLLPRSPTPLLSWVDSQHNDLGIARVYESLFFATTLPKEWREWSSKLHISHLFAISGLHLGILAWVLYLLLEKPYTFFQSRYFTYRNKTFDIGAIVLLCLLAYVWILNFPPALIRAFVMSVVGLIFLWSHIRLLSFSFLLFCVMVILALFPQFMLNFGFWFSVCGVYFILLFFKYFHTQLHGFLKFIYIAVLLNTFLFFQMLPLSHWVFPLFCISSLYAIGLSILFPLFFILALFAHILGVGWIFDGILHQALLWELPAKNISTPLYFALPYLILCILALKYRWSYYATLGLGCVFYVFLVVKMLR